MTEGDVLKMSNFQSHVREDSEPRVPQSPETPVVQSSIQLRRPDRRQRPISRAREYGIANLLSECKIKFVQEKRRRASATDDAPIIWSMRPASDENYAATRIQAIWRGAITRVRYRPVLSKRLRERSRRARERIEAEREKK